VIALLAPGQGSQTPGMLTPWLELPGAEDRIALWSKAAGLDLATLGTTATAEEITDTAVTQPLVVAAALLAFEEMVNRGIVPEEFIVAGHSVGELAAAAIAGVITADEAVSLAAIRGAEMAKACALEETGMSAVLGGDEDEVLARLAELELVPANRNAVGQIVAATGEGPHPRIAGGRRVPHRFHGTGTGRRDGRCGQDHAVRADPDASVQFRRRARHVRSRCSD